MIYGGSNDPVFIKKISLRLWTLRDELEAVIQKRLENIDPQNDPKKAIEDLLEEYSAKRPDAEVIDLSSPLQGAGEVDPLEAEMAAAIAGGGAGSDGDANAVDPFEAAMAAAIDGEEEEAPANDAINDPQEESGDPEVQAASEVDESAEEMAAQMIATGTVVEEEIESEPVKSNVVALYQRRPNLPADKVMSGKTVMAEVGMDEIYFFCGGKLLVGQSIVIEFQIPKRFRLCAEIRYCRQYNMKSRIISENALPYRIVAKWTYLRPGERTLLRQFIESIEPVIAQVQVKGPIKPKEGDGDDFDELDDLDL